MARFQPLRLFSKRSWIFTSMTSLAKHIVAAVDDDFRVRESIASLMESAGYTSLVYGSAEEFLKSGSLQAADCMITDVRMPGMDGLELQRRVRLERPGLAVILISAHNDEEIRRRALDQGAAGFLSKPFDAAELLGTIELALNDSSGHGAGV
jgi:FixJ family two-component response regulator